MTESFGYAANKAGEPLKPFKFMRREVGARDVLIDITHCGICHSDIHHAKNEWGRGIYPMVPGHEVVGVVKKVGAAVTRFSEGDRVGVGCFVDSCRECSECESHQEQFCDEKIFTYNSPNKHTNGITYGGYSSNMVVDEDFVLSIPDNLDMSAAAPLLCAGITTYSPLKHWNIKAGDHVGVVGLGGLGHMAVKIAKAMGAHVTVFSRSTHKIEDAKRLRADDVIISTDTEALNKAANSLNFILDTVSASHDIDTYLQLLKHDGHLVFVGIPDQPHPPYDLGNLIYKRRSISGSLIGGIKETQEMLDFCGKHNIVSEIEMIKADEINAAFDRVLRSDVKYRFVIDMSTL